MTLYFEILPNQPASLGDGVEVDELEVVERSLWQEVVELLHGGPGPVPHSNHHDAQGIHGRVHDGLDCARLLRDLTVRYHYQDVVSTRNRGRQGSRKD